MFDMKRCRPNIVLRARLEKHELLTELSMSKEQALLLTELTKN